VGKTLNSTAKHEFYDGPTYLDNQQDNSK